MLNRSILVFLLLQLFLNTAFTQSFDPVNKNASPAARELLQYLYSVSGKKIISGQCISDKDMDKWPQYIKDITGKLPAVWGSGFYHYYVDGYADKIVNEAIKRHQEGHIITLMWHTGRPQDNPPFDWKTSTQGEMTDKEWKELTTPGTPLYKKWESRVDTIAGYLKKLQRAKVPVLWRPYHEMNGIWFWWGDKKGENGYVKLWKMMYDRFVHHHKLNNLIWVWNANAPRDLKDDEAYDYNLYFPGSDYVDVLAADIYHNDYKQSHHDDLLKLAKGKLIALGEVGEVPDPEILKQQPMWTWFMIWVQWAETHNTPGQIKKLYNHPETLSLEEVRAEKHKFNR